MFTTQSEIKYLATKKLLSLFLTTTKYWKNATTKLTLSYVGINLWTTYYLGYETEKEDKSNVKIDHGKKLGHIPVNVFNKNKLAFCRAGFLK